MKKIVLPAYVCLVLIPSGLTVRPLQGALQRGGQPFKLVVKLRTNEFAMTIQSVQAKAERCVIALVLELVREGLS